MRGLITRTLLWIFAALEVATVVLAGWSFIRGDSLAGIKLMLAAGLVPAVGLFIWWTVRVVTTPHWYRSMSTVATVAFASGVVITFVPILAYMPFAPARFRFDDAPYGLAGIVRVGAALTFAGLLMTTLAPLPEAWRERNRGRVMAILIVAGIFVFILVRAVVR